MKKIIITESQYQRIFEERKSKTELFQEIITNEFDNIKAGCDSFDFLRLPDGISYDTCIDSEVIDNIKVDEVKMMSSSPTKMDGTSSLYIKLTINCSAPNPKTEFDAIVFDLKQLLVRKTGGIPLSIDYQINTM
jgi:hypothetical protein